MGKHFIHETDYRSTYSEYHRLLYCEWCGIVVWNFNANDRTNPTIKEYQEKAGSECKANPTIVRTPDLSQASTGLPKETQGGKTHES